MWSIVVLTARGGREDVARDLGRLATFAWCERAADVLARTEMGGVDLVIVGTEDETGRSIAPTLVELAAQVPAPPVLIHDRVDGATLSKLMRVVVTGARMECAVRPHERLERVVRRLTSPDFRPGVVPVLLRHFVPRAPEPLRVFVALAALSASWHRSVEVVTLWSGVSSRVIQRRLRGAGWPSARTIVRSFAALDAVWLMSVYGWSARRVTQDRAFSHESSVTRLLERYCRMRPANLREAGGFPAALARVSRTLAPRPRA